ncbi:MAG: Hsp20/alpha crystallin family protein [Chloroherpetonaceae bacterium]|nr:Hsp20/alpha crystallin family protein [Chthonomonadaceae bacterium]MDW8206617.1 Hsp20/alpha crystallin family protein [Chloroherpetonaceae bacterium]
MAKLNVEPTDIVRWNPFQELAEMRQRMEELFNRGFSYTPIPRLFPTEAHIFEPALECVRTEKALEVFVPVPGFTPEEITVEVQDTNLTIKGERPPLFDQKKEEVRVPGWATTKATFAINYTLPVEVVPGEVKATLQNGVLHLTLPIAAKAIAKTVPVKVLPI